MGNRMSHQPAAEQLSLPTKGASRAVNAARPVEWTPQTVEDWELLVRVGSEKETMYLEKLAALKEAASQGEEELGQDLGLVMIQKAMVEAFSNENQQVLEALEDAERML